MIIACPACRTRYVVPDTAIGVDGRTVRCAKCKHSWFQDGHGLPDEPAPHPRPPAPPPQPQPPQQGDGYAASASHAPQPQAPPPQMPQGGAQPAGGSREPQAETARPAPQIPRGAMAVPAPQPGFTAIPRKVSFDEGFAPRRQAEAVQQPEPPPPVAPVEEPTAPPFAEIRDDLPPPTPEPDDDWESSFDHAPPFAPRRNMGRIFTIMAALFALAALGAIAAVAFYGPPSWLPIARPLFGGTNAELKLEFPQSEQERRTLDNGTEYFGARVRVTNTARESRDVPDILIVMRDERERQVYSWVVKPPQPRLAPGETMTINEARTDVPKSAVFADIGWAPR